MVTEYNFNEEKKEIFDKPTKPGIPVSRAWRLWTNIIIGDLEAKTLDEVMVSAQDEDGKETDDWGTYYIYDGSKNFDVSIGGGAVMISDDPEEQIENDTYCYINGPTADTLVSYKYARLGLTYSGGDEQTGLCILNTPQTNYSVEKWPMGRSIYDDFWADYISERYSIQNKLVTCYLRLSPQDIIDWKWNRFVKIGNIVYMVNKVSDFDVAGNKSTKVELISVTDMNKYK